MLKRLVSCICAAALATSIVATSSFADEGNEQIYYIGSVVNAGLDTGYNESNEITRQDPHFGWSLGRFAISGYTAMSETPDGTPIFLKTEGDKVRLSFELAQNINAINGNESLTVSEDSDGYDL